MQKRQEIICKVSGVVRVHNMSSRGHTDSAIQAISMIKYDYLIIGGGMAADSAIQAIRKIDANGTIGVICKENHSPYDRPSLSRALWFDGDVDNIWRNTGNLGANLHLSRTATSLFPDKRIVYDHEGQIYSYEKLLIASGSKPRRLEIAPEDLVYLHDLDDYFELRKLAEKYEHFCVIGGGFIGTEIAASLIAQKKYVTMFFSEKGPLADILPKTISKHLLSELRAGGVNVVIDERVTGAEKIGREIVVKTNRDSMLAFDVVVAGMGSIPETDIASTGDLKLDGSGGILVNDRLQTSRHDIFAAGDVASFPSKALGSVIRYSHAENANAMGVVAGKNMAGMDEAYDLLPSYSSKIFGNSYLAIGDVDSRYNYVIDWVEEPSNGVVYYLVGGLVRGILFWNVPGDVEEARKRILERKPHNVHTLKGLLP